MFSVFLSDILGSEELHPKHLLYHVPNYLKGVHKAEKHFQVRRLRGFIPGKIIPYILFQDPTSSPQSPGAHQIP